MAVRMPAEHGAWGILLIPLLSSAAVAGGGWQTCALVTACALGLFILRGSCDRQPTVRAMLTADHLLLSAVVIASGAVLLLAYQRRQLAGIAAAGAVLYAVHHWLLRRHQQTGEEKRSLAAELVGVLLLTLAAPAAWIAQRGTLDAAGARLWLLNLLFFAGGVLYVKYRVRGLLAHRVFQSLAERAEFAWPVFVYHLLLALFLVGLIAVDSVSVMALLAFAPAIVRAHGLLFHLGRKFPIKRLGWSEVAHAVLFASLLVIALR